MSKATVFALSIQPFINASIIVQLLTYALPPLERLSKEGEEGRKKIDKISSIVSLVLAVFMAFALNAWKNIKNDPEAQKKLNLKTKKESV